jgi:threonyl-tRNA synthetase
VRKAAGSNSGGLSYAAAPASDTHRTTYICRLQIRFFRKESFLFFMIKITLPDGSVREYEPGVSALDVAKSISEGLARKVLAAEVNGEVRDATRPIESDATLKLLTWDDKGGKSTFWHSSAHLMAEALQSFYPDTKFAIGPPIENGFYYDIDLGDQKISDADLAKIEAKMKELAKGSNAYVRRTVPKEEAIGYFSHNNDPYKL